MGLIVPRWGFKNHANLHTQNGIGSANSVGTTIIGHVTAHTKSATQAILSAVDFDVHLIAVGWSSANNAGATRQCVGDLMYDPAGGTSWSVLIPDMIFGQNISVQALVCHNQIYVLPVWAPAGSSFGLRFQSVNTSIGVAGAVWVWGEPSRPELWWCGTKVEVLGVTTSGASAGTQFTPGNNAWSSPWTTIGTSTKPYGAYQMGIGPGNDTTLNARYYLMQLGIGDAQMPGSPTQYFGTTNAEIRAYAMPQCPLFCDIPSGVVFQARGYCNTTPEVQCVGMYGVY